MAAVLPAGTSYSQNEEDALRYSLSYFGGSARNMSTAGALSAMGGDFSNASQNPAGLGRIKKRNFSLTQNLEIPFVKTDFYGSADRDSRAAYNWSNLSFVKAYELNPNKYKNWYTVQVGIGMNRIKSFNQDIRYSGAVDSSILHSFIREAEGTPETEVFGTYPFTAGMAYWVYGIDPDPNNPNAYITDFDSGQAEHERTIKRSGGMTEFNLLTLSGNYGNKLLVGGSFNVVYSNFKEEFTHKETYTDSSLWLRSIKYTGLLDIKGRGINARIGAIYMPTEQFRFGAAVETPTLMWMSDYWTNNMSTDTDGGKIFLESEEVPSGSYKYKIKTPFKANLSAAYVNKKWGTAGIEVEYVDHANSKLSSRRNDAAPYGFNAENLQINNIYRSVFNLRVGVEARINKQAYARAGYAHYAAPYTAESGNSLSPTHFITTGLGYNFGKFYLDLAYVLQSKKADYYAYDPTINGSHATFDIDNSQIALTLGARF